MDMINTADLYIVRQLVLAGKTVKLSLNEVDDLIAYNAVHQFAPYGVRGRIEEALRDGTDRQAEGSRSTLH